MPTYEFSTEELQGEQWKSVVGYFSELYSVSSLGRIRQDCQRKNTYAGRILKPLLAKDGYHYVELSYCSQQRRYAIQRLVMWAFVGPRPEGYTINHIDGIKTNNRVSNLEYITLSQNIQHALNMGLSARGEAHKMSKLSNEQVREIKQQLKNAKRGMQVKLAKKYGVNPTAISKIKLGQHWKHI